MRRGLVYKTLLLLPAILFIRNGVGQVSFVYKSALGTVQESGFYKIIVPPAVIAKCREGIEDIRILDDRDKQVPYILKTDREEFRENSFIEFPVVSIKKEADKQTHVVIENRLNTISELLLIIKNTDAERMVSISGSDDEKQWFIIKEDILLKKFVDGGKDRFIQSVSFPTSSYKFFKIIINGKDLLPVNIVKAGIYEGLFHDGTYVPVPDPSVTQADSTNNASYISVLFNDEYQVDKLDLTIQGPKFYKRRLDITKGTGRLVEPIGTYTVSSEDATTYVVKVKTKQLTLLLQNADNPPLKVSSVKAFQLNRYLLTYLEPGRNYALTFGSSTAHAPAYDLEFFKDSIRNIAKEIIPGPILKNDEAKNAETNTRTILLWVVIASVLGVLLVLTLRMTKEVGKNPSKNL